MAADSLFTIIYLDGLICAANLCYTVPINQHNIGVLMYKQIYVPTFEVGRSSLITR